MCDEDVYLQPDPKDEIIQRAMMIYKDRFIKPLPRVAVYAPAKVTIVGDHTQTFGGHTLTMPLPLYTVAVGAPNNEHIIRLVDFDLNTKLLRETEFPIPPMHPIKKSEPEWANLIKAALTSFKGLILEGFNVVLVTDIPRGQGLGGSSSAVICMYTFLESITREWTSDLSLKAQLCAKAEQEFTNVPEPFADCLTIAAGQPDNAFLIDCGAKSATNVPVDHKSYAFLLALVPDSERSVGLLETRMNECEKALTIVGAKNLVDLQVIDLQVHKEQLAAAGDVTLRIRHLISEHLRVSKAANAMKEAQYLKLGRIMNQSQTSARYDYEISNDVLDTLTNTTLEVNEVLGTRITGAGVGCSTIILVKRSALNEVLVLLRKKTDIRTIFIQAGPCKGAGDVSSKLFNLERAGGKLAVDVFTQVEYGVEQYKLNYFDKKISPSTASYAPGRVYVLGEHCAANNGSVLQMALPMGTTVIGALNNTEVVNIVVEEDVAGSESTRASFVLPTVRTIESGSDSWTNLFRAVMKTFHGPVKRGFDCVVVCSLPPIAGLARATSIVVAFYTFLECIYKDYLCSWVCKAKRCFLAQEMVDKCSSSIADHLTIITSCDGCLSHIDCWNLRVRSEPFPKKEYCFLLCDSNMERAGAGLMFPGHENECMELQEVLGPLRLLTQEKLKKATREGRVSSGMAKRGAHVIKEATRVYQGLRAIQMKDMQAFGLLMLQSHNSLVSNYEIFEWNQKQLVALGMEQRGVLGAKMTGSENSSCTLTLVNRADSKGAVNGIRCRYKGYVMIYEVDPKEGCQDVTKVLERELSRRKDNIDVFEVDLSEDTLEAEDLDELSWPMFDLDNEWKVWESKGKETGGEFVEKSQESFREVDEVLSEETGDEDGQLHGEDITDQAEGRRSEIESKRLEAPQQETSDLVRTDDEGLTSESTDKRDKEINSKSKI